MRRAFVVLVAAFLSASAWAGHKLISISPAQRAALHIATAPITSHAGAISVGLPASVTIPPAQERVVAAPVAGLITGLKAAVGEPVRAGQVLATLRSEQLTAGQRDVAQAAVQLHLAEASAERDAALFKEGIIPEARLQAARATLQQARAALAERRAWCRLMGLSAAEIQAVERGERLVDTVSLSAPITGTVLEQMALTGARLEAAGPVYRIGRLDPLWLEIQAPAELAALVRKGQPVSVPGTQAKGEVVAVGRSVSAAQTVMVRARVGNPGGQLRLNQNIAARIEGVSGSKQWQVPAKALVRQQGQSYVFVERPGGFEPEMVGVLSQTAESAAVDGAFSGEEKIAVEGVVALKAIWQGDKETGVPAEAKASDAKVKPQGSGRGQ